jgi:hypothetical protein
MNPKKNQNLSPNFNPYYILHLILGDILTWNLT